MNMLKTSIGMVLIFLVLTGGVFPGVVWIGAQILFPHQANGSFITGKDGIILGSELIGQNFTDPKYFQPRPSAAGSGYDPTTSGGSNLGPTSRKLLEGVKDDPSTLTDESYSGLNNLARNYRELNGVPSEIKLPSDAVTRSASGLDPHISLHNAYLQAHRVSTVRSVSIDSISKLINQASEPRFLGIWGEPRVNVLKLNIALNTLETGRSQ